MSTQTLTKKRESADGSAAVIKKAKIARSADKPAPAKSALKKANGEKLVKKPTVSATKARPVKAATAVAPSNQGDDSRKKNKRALLDSPATEATSLPAKAQDKQSGTVDNEEDDNTTLTPDQTAALLAGFSSSDDEDEDGALTVQTQTQEKEQGISDSAIKSALQSFPSTTIPASTSSDPETTPGVLYIGRLPHGFYEHQLSAYFSQFGTVTRLRLARNRKTGRSKHYAFLQFASASVADIVARTMDKYLLFGHILQVRVVPAVQVGEGMWAGKGKRVAPRNRLEGLGLRRGMGREGWEKRVIREGERRERKRIVLRELGYEFEMPGLRAVEEVPRRVKGGEEGKGLEGGEEVPAVVGSEEVKVAEVIVENEDDGVKLGGDGDGADEAKVEIVRTAEATAHGVTVTETQTKTKKRPSLGKVKGGAKKLKA